LNKKISISKKKITTISVCLVIAVILISTLSYFIIFNLEEDKEEKKISKEEKIDDRISPLTNQAIFLKIHRIRKKGIINVMMNSGSKVLSNLLNPKDIKIDSKNGLIKLRMIKALDGMRPGFGWDEKPSFSYVVTLDGYEFKGIETYRKWDTGYMNQQIFRNVEEEKEKTEIQFKIVEKQVKRKIFGNKLDVKTEETDEFKVVYDFRTGRWDGDDYLKDNDGYGHYDGENYEIWFSLYQTSSDMDTIPFWVEKNILNTDPRVDDSKLDPDKDGIPTEWEWKWGYDPFTWDNHTFLDPDRDGIQNVEEYYIAEWLSDPYHQDIYLEVDYMDQTPKMFLNRYSYDGWKHVLYEESQQMLIERFNEHNISLHIDDGCMGKGGDIIPFYKQKGVLSQEVGIVAGFYDNNFTDERKGIFRYLVVASVGGWCHPQDYNHFYDCMCIPHNFKFFKNQLGFSVTERTERIGLAISVLHELGHSLGMHLDHSGGVDNVSSRNNYPKDYPWYDYVSVMNYDYYWLRYFDYSDGSHGKYDTNDWERIDLTAFQKTTLNSIEGVGS